jgi:putative PIN family toxin of toxin-antitoxin system
LTLRVACDTNVLVSAFIAAGPPSRVLEEAIDSRLEFVLLSPAMVELERILTGKLGFEPERWRAVEDLLVGLAADLAPAPSSPPEAVTGDLADDLILACAIQVKVEVLISGDRRHLLPVGEHRGVRIITPQALLAELRGA